MLRFFVIRFKKSTKPINMKALYEVPVVGGGNRGAMIAQLKRKSLNSEFPLALIQIDNTERRSTQI